MALPRSLVAPVVGGLKLAALRPGVPWSRSRMLIEAGLALPGAPAATRVASLDIGGVRCEEVRLGSVQDETRAVLYFHGGGYVVCSPRTQRPITAALSAAFGARVVVPDYRLAPEHPHPAAFEDCLAAWRALTGPGGLAAERMAVAGDSAGVGLALALVLSLRASGAALPGALGLICPYVDPRADIEQRRAPVPGDRLLDPGLMTRFATAYLGPREAALSTLEADPLLSPLAADLSGLPPMIVHTCSEDTLRDDGLSLVAKARADGVEVVHESLDGFWHDPHLSARLLGEPVHGATARMGAQLRDRILRAPTT